MQIAWKLGVPGALLFLSLASRHAGAAPLDAPEPIAGDGPWTLEEVVRLVRERNPAFASLEASRAAAQAAIAGASAFPNPEAEGEAVLSQGRDAPRDREAEFALRVEQPLEWPWKRWARIEAADAGARAAEADGALLAAALRAETAKAYYAVLFAERSAAGAEEARRIAARVRDLAALRVAAGEAAEIDFVKARVESLKADREARAERRALSTARIALGALTSFALPENYVLAGELAASLPRIDAAAALARAEEHHPAVQRALAALDAARRAADREEWAWAPDLRPAAIYAREADKESVGGALAFEIPLWSRNSGAIGEAEAEVHRAEAELRAARREVEREARRALERLEGAREALAVFDGGLREAAAEALRIETRLYEQGETDLLQLLDAQRTARETEVERLLTLYEANVARAELEFALGGDGSVK